MDLIDQECTTPLKIELCSSFRVTFLINKSRGRLEDSGRRSMFTGSGKNDTELLLVWSKLLCGVRRVKHRPMLAICLDCWSCFAGCYMASFPGQTSSIIIFKGDTLGLKQGFEYLLTH